MNKVGMNIEVIMNRREFSRLFYLSSIAVYLFISIVLVNSCNFKSELKVGFIYIGSVDDGGWTTSHENARKRLAENNKNIRFTKHEKVKVAELESLIDDLVKKRYNLIFTTSYDFEEVTYKSALKHPNVVFFNCAGLRTRSNLGTYFVAMEEARYLSGIVAGMMTANGKIGYVASKPTSEVLRIINGFTLGVRSVNPNADVHVKWVSSWFDPIKEKIVADYFINREFDVIVSGVDSKAVVVSVEESGKPIYSIGYGVDEPHYAPRSYLHSSVWNWHGIYSKIIDDYLAGKVTDWRNHRYYCGIVDDGVDISKMRNNVPINVKKTVEAVREELLKGEIKIFKGPLLSNNGVEVIRSGEVADLTDLLYMDYLVDGVIVEK